MGRIVALIGPSGTGKTTIARMLLDTPLAPRMVTSLTTRVRRPSDLPNEYEYVQLETLLRMGEEHALLWLVQHGSVFYGTPKVSVADVLDEPMATGIMILVPDVIEKLKNFVFMRQKSWAGFIPIYLEPPPEPVLIERMRERGDTDEQIEDRLRLEQDWNRWLRKTTLPLRRVSTADAPKYTLSCVLHYLGTQDQAAF